VLVHTATTEAEQAHASVTSLQVSVRIEALVHTATTEAEQARASVASLQVSVKERLCTLPLQRLSKRAPLWPASRLVLGCLRKDLIFGWYRYRYW
jgi:hypothetical protein